jgi:peptide/nickel transport system substrate-binding protein
MRALTRLAVVALVLLAGAPAAGSGVAAGTLRVASVEPPNSIDPAFGIGEPAQAILSATCLKLLNYRDREGKAGSLLVAEAAERMPTVSADGRTYTFTVRRGLRFSDGHPITAANYEAAAYRLFHPRMNTLAALSGGGDDIVGIREFRTRKAKRIPGIGVQGRRFVLRLVRRNPDVLHRLASTYMCPVPVGFPLDPTGVEDPPVPGSGPYFIASYRAGREVVLRRNAHYRGTRPRNVDEIRIAIGGTPEANAAAVERGDLDYSFNGAPGELADLVARYGVNQRRLWIKTGPYTSYLALNTSRPLFRDNAPLRRAVNFAVDRSEIVRQGGHILAGRPTDQLLPPTMPGYRNVALYPLAKPDLARARQLAAGRLRGGHATLYVADFPLAERRARIVQLNLEQLGLEVDVKVMTVEVLLYRVSQPDEPYDLVYVNWLQDWPDPTNFLVPILHKRGIPKAKVATLAAFSLSHNFSRFDDPAVNARIDAAAKLSGSARYSAFARIEADTLRDKAPIAPLFHFNDVVLVSERVGCVTYSPVYRLDLVALCLR